MVAGIRGRFAIHEDGELVAVNLGERSMADSLVRRRPASPLVGPGFEGSRLLCLAQRRREGRTGDGMRGGRMRGRMRGRMKRRREGWGAGKRFGAIEDDSGAVQRVICYRLEMGGERWALGF